MPWIKIIKVQLKQDVINPQYSSMTRGRYLLAETGEVDYFDDPGAKCYD